MARDPGLGTGIFLQCLVVLKRAGVGAIIDIGDAIFHRNISDMGDAVFHHLHR